MTGGLPDPEHTLEPGTMDIPAYVLTIYPPGEGRRVRMAHEFARARFPWRFFEGVTIQAPDLWQPYSRLQNLLFYKYSVSAPEMACYLSHRAIWREIADGQAEAALVFEDDAFIKDDTAFYQALDDIRRNLGHFDVVKFHDFRPKAAAVTKTVGQTTLASYRWLPTSAACYLISKAAARKLLARERLFRPIDVDWTYAWELGVKIWSVHPNPVVTDDEGISSISDARSTAGRSPWRRVWNEILTVQKRLQTARYHAALAKD
jgi:GR25 family glycosyltransferase involved in LPS biosynthesis